MTPFEHFSRIECRELLGCIFNFTRSCQTAFQSISFRLVPPGFPVAQRLKRLPPMRETRVQSLGWEDPMEKEMVTHSSILIWRIPWMEKPGRLQSTGSQRVRHNWATSHTQSHSQSRVLFPSFYPVLVVIVRLCSSATQSCSTLCDTMDCQASLSLIISRSLLTHVRWVGDAIQPSLPLSSHSPTDANWMEGEGVWISFVWNPMKP